jgi:hypothetical protein
MSHEYLHIQSRPRTRHHGVSKGERWTEIHECNEFDLLIGSFDAAASQMTDFRACSQMAAGKMNISDFNEKLSYSRT